MNTLIPFSSKINFVDRRTFEQKTSHISRVQNAETAYQPNPNEDSRFIGGPYNTAKTSYEGLTEFIHGCNAGGLVNRDAGQVTFFHLKPAVSDCFDSEGKNKILEKLARMSVFTPRLSGLIIGGKAIVSTDPLAKKSIALTEKLKTFFKELNASISNFSAQRSPSGHSNIYYSGNEDTWYVNYKDDGGYSTLHDINTAADIKQAYSNISVAKEDDVFINNAPIDKFALNHRGYTEIPGGYELCLFDMVDNNNQKTVGYFDRAKVFPADFGNDPSTVWVEINNPQSIGVVEEQVKTLNESPLFKNINKIQVALKEAPEGYTYMKDIDSSLKLYEKVVSEG